MEAENTADEQYIDNVFRRNEAAENMNLDRYNFPLQSYSNKSTQQFSKNNTFNLDQLSTVQRNNSTKENQMNLRNCSFTKPTKSFTFKMKYPPKKFKEIKCSTEVKTNKPRPKSIRTSSKVKAYDRYINENLEDLMVTLEQHPHKTFVNKRANSIKERHTSSGSFMPSNNIDNNHFHNIGLEQSEIKPHKDMIIRNVKCNDEIEEYSFIKSNKKVEIKKEKCIDEYMEFIEVDKKYEKVFERLKEDKLRAIESVIKDCLDKHQNTTSSNLSKIIIEKYKEIINYYKQLKRILKEEQEKESKDIIKRCKHT